MTAPPTAAPVRAPRSRLRPFAAGFWFGGFNGLTWMIGLGTPMVLLCEQLGASAFQVGLAASFVFLLLPLQVLSTTALPRLGYRRQMVLGWSLRALFLFVPLALALAAPTPPAPWMASALVASVFCFCCFRAFGVAAHIPWMAAILPLEIRGRFFASEGATTSVVGVATLLACAALFERLPPWPAFTAVYALALVGSAGAIASLLRLPPAPPPRVERLAALPAATLRLCLEPGPFRFYLALSLLGTVAFSAVGAFTAYYLKAAAGFASSSILGFTAAQFAGSILGAFGVRIAIDRSPIRRFFRLQHALHLAVYLYWLAFVAGAQPLAGTLAAAYLVLGVGAGIGSTAHLTYLPELAEEDGRPLMIAVFTAVHGVGSGLAPMLWGLWLGRGGAAIDGARFAVFFAAAAALSVLVLARLPALHDPRFDRPPRASDRAG